ncbi:MAG: hypothetical protein RLZZ58_2105 [Pseudomonadota bacterium]
MLNAAPHRRAAAPLILTVWALALAAPPALAAETPAPASPADEPLTTEIIVNAPRLSGQVATEIPADLTLDSDAIASYGASSVTDLLAALAPQTRSGRGRGDGQPVVLVNGRRVSGMMEIRNLPSDAIAKVEVFPEEVALEYGYAADQRVINFVLKPDFRSISTDIEFGQATDGGRGRVEADNGFLRISDKGRVNITAIWESNGLLRESERGLVQPPLAAVSSTGLPIVDSGAVIDGEGARRSLLPATDRYAVDATIARYLPGDIDVTATLGFEQLDSRSLLGQARALIDVAATSPYAPGGQAVAVRRTLADVPQRDGDATNYSAGMTVAGRINRWRWTATGSFARRDSLTLTSRGPGATEIANAQAAVNAGTVNPFTAAIDPLLTPAGGDVNDTRADNFDFNLTANGTVFEGWAGPVRTTLSGGYSGLRLDSAAMRSGVSVNSNLARDTANGRFTLVVPLLDPEYGSGFIGRLGANANVAVADHSDFGTLISWGAGLDWSPAEGLSLLAGMTRDKAAPTIQQLGTAPQVTPGVTFFDFARGQTVLIETVSGGNPLLAAERRRDVKLGASFSPPGLRDLNLTVNWNRNRSFNTSNAFPLLTQEIEAAFASRVTRDAGGRLIRVDQRPVNYAREATEQIRWGVSFSKSFGQPQGRPGGPGGGGPGPGAGGPGAGAPPGGPPRGPGMGGGGIRGFGGPGGNGGRWSLSLFHTYRIDDRVRIRANVPELDRLNGSATGSDGGSSRHLFEMEGGWFFRGFGTRFSGRYDSGSKVNGSTAASSLDFGGLATLNVRAFVNFDNQPSVLKSVPVLKGSRIRLSLDNIFNARRDVRDATGTVPIRYQPGYIDPLGRYVELSFRKAF